MSAPTFAALVQGFFTDRLLRQMRASPNTVSGDRDAFRLPIRYATDRLGKVPSDLTLEDLDPSLVIDFLDHLDGSLYPTVPPTTRRTVRRPEPRSRGPSVLARRESRRSPSPRPPRRSDPRPSIRPEARREQLPRGSHPTQGVEEALGLPAPPSGSQTELLATCCAGREGGRSAPPLSSSALTSVPESMCLRRPLEPAGLDELLAADAAAVAAPAARSTPQTSTGRALAGAHGGEPFRRPSPTQGLDGVLTGIAAAVAKSAVYRRRSPPRGERHRGRRSRASSTPLDLAQRLAERAVGRRAAADLELVAIPGGQGAVLPSPTRTQRLDELLAADRSAGRTGAVRGAFKDGRIGASPPAGSAPDQRTGAT
jgi:hypothetical protein